MLDRTLLDTSERFRKCVNPDFSLFFCYSLFFLGCTESSLVHEGFLRLQGAGELDAVASLVAEPRL